MDSRAGPLAWFTAAMAAGPQRGEIVVEGVPVRYRYWGESRPDRPDVVLVHGAAAQGAWWDHVGPLLARDRRVTAPDLSGHGDSGWRASYDFRTWAAEVVAVAEASSPRPRPVLVGHSMGGEVVLHAAGVLGSWLAGAVVVDPLSHDVTSPEAHARTQRVFGQPYVHATREEAMKRFRVIPPQPTLPLVEDHIAATSVREVAGGWTWKYDPNIFNVERGGLSRPSDIACPLALLHPEHGLANEQAMAALAGQIDGTVQIVGIPAAAHHVMLDEPLSLVTGLRALLTGSLWTG